MMTNLKADFSQSPKSYLGCHPLKNVLTKYLRKYHFRKLIFTEYFIFRMCWFDVVLFCVWPKSVIPFSICRGHLKETKLYLDYCVSHRKL